jgi:hypothetical protein
VPNNTYCADEIGFMFSVGRVFAIQPNEEHLTEIILGILNSSLSEFLMTSLCPIKQGGFYKISSQYLNSFPLPQLNKNENTKIRELVTQIQNNRAKELNENESLEKQIDRLVYQLYDLTKEEIEIIENSKNL